MTTNDERMMRLAVDTACTARLRSRPNPWVGAVVVAQNGEVFTGATLEPGNAHAEIVALNAAAHHAQGSTLFSTLEPCNHTGRTGPCTQAIIDAGVSRVVVGTLDPDSKVSGSGVQQLRNAGLTVDVGILEQEVKQQLAAYLHHRATGRPFVVLKMASTIDGRIAATDGSSKWITGETARKRVHQLRAESDAIVVGAGTVRADDPSLTVRDADGPSPRRIVLGTIDVSAKVHPCTQWTGTLPDLLDTLGKEGVVQLLVEGGARVAASFHRERLINQYIMHIAPVIAGGDDAAGVFAGPAASTMTDMWRGRIVSTTNLDGDIEIILEPNLN
ncbi:MAG: bifunctional diaminohydroxyphosphoribosylaminopyrimidine deaminase/5-amino-6-(5-phosphoribosylamino)uracil reductase RibD [Actinobacteria bacterium]|nr:bifunctional diaminohydroxyphosphoribosylaminopyrimidine deaminase/5-amino-6-(5-phosphoribosylamino)uracil reductase RibD [Actinomycetota bacterium]